MILNGHYAITPEALNNLFPLADQLQAAAANTPAPAPSSFQIIDGSAIINIAGIIFPKANIFTLFGFGVAIDSLAEQLSAAEKNPAVKNIVFYFDSPGGNITGVNEFQTRSAPLPNKPLPMYPARRLVRLIG